MQEHAHDDDQDSSALDAEHDEHGVPGVGVGARPRTVRQGFVFVGVGNAPDAPPVPHSDDDNGPQRGCTQLVPDTAGPVPATATELATFTSCDS